MTDVNDNQEEMLERKHSGEVQQTKKKVMTSKLKDNTKDSWLDPPQ